MAREKLSVRFSSPGKPAPAAHPVAQAAARGGDQGAHVHAQGAPSRRASLELRAAAGVGAGGVSEADFRGEEADLRALLLSWMGLEREVALLAAAEGGGEAAAVGAGGAPGGADEGAAFPGAERMAKALAAARADVGQLRREAKARALRLEREVAEEEASHATKLASHDDEGGARALFEAFERLDTRVTHVAHTAVRVGQRLRRADDARARALEAADLIAEMRAFAACGGVFELLPALFRDDGRAAEAARRAMRLLAVAQQVAEQAHAGGGGAGDAAEGSASAEGGDAVLSSGAVQVRSALRSLEAYVEALENRVAAQFDEAREAGDAAAMGAAARAAADFGACERLARRFVASCEAFIDPQAPERDARAARAGPGAAGLRLIGKDVLASARRDAALIDAVFPDAASAKEAYLTRVLEQRVNSALEALLADAHAGVLPLGDAGQGGQGGAGGAGKSSRVVSFVTAASSGLSSEAERVAAGAGSGSGYVRTLASAHEVVLDLAAQLAEVGAAGSLDAIGLASSLFHERRGGYVDEEVASLFHMRAEADAKHDTRQGRAEDLLALARQTVGWHRDACARCSAMLRGEVASARAAAGARLLDALLDQTCGSAVEAATRAAETGRAECDALDRLTDRGSGGTAGDTAAGSAECLRALMRVIEGSRGVAAVAAAHATECVLPLIPQRAVEASEASKRLAAAGNELQAACLAALQEAARLVCAHARAILKAFQCAADFAPAADEPLEARPTAACEKLVAFFKEAAALADRTLASDSAAGAVGAAGERRSGGGGGASAANLQRFTAAVGAGVSAAIEEHLFGAGRWTFSALGAVRLRRDIGEYAQTARAAGAMTFAARADVLNEHATLLVVAPESVASLLRGELRGVVTPEEATKVLKLREDARSTGMAAALRKIDRLSER